ncbi:GlsB/YeaQ/YmgE family stress response membrane protein [uncultured Finegoldia sp.]|uniref:GlsB/YeaQ/YmgE family stress response membrane protein n=1 Tax=uncultured Finegoldia sp. TaxID=328009 RepID=UPI00262514E3|nr:GlsB/YeaQ/YmgE family stress response membrane protein [uncultured Finegoldia sp.]
MGFISWIIVGALAGWIASKITGNDKSMGAGANIICGIVGAIIGGWVMSFFGKSGVTGFNLYSVIVSIIGSVILLSVINKIKSK